MENRCLEKVFNNYIENYYYKLLFILKNKEETIKIFYQLCDYVFLFDNYDITKAHDRIEKMCDKLIRNYKGKCNNKNQLVLDYSIPNDLYLFNYNLCRLFNHQDISIFLYFWVYNHNVDTISKITGFDNEYIIQRYKSMCSYIRKTYLRQMKNETSVN